MGTAWHPRNVEATQIFHWPVEGTHPIRLDLSALDVLGFQALVAGNDIERDRFTLIQCLEAPAYNGCVMNKNILAGFLGYEPKAFFVIEPLYFATCHIFSPDDCVQLNVSKTGSALLA